MSVEIRTLTGRHCTRPGYENVEPVNPAPDLPAVNADFPGEEIVEFIEKAPVLDLLERLPVSPGRAREEAEAFLRAHGRLPYKREG